MSPDSLLFQLCPLGSRFPEQAPSVLFLWESFMQALPQAVLPRRLRHQAELLSVPHADLRDDVSSWPLCGMWARGHTDSSSEPGSGRGLGQATVSPNKAQALFLSLGKLFSHEAIYSPLMRPEVKLSSPA